MPLFGRSDGAPEFVRTDAGWGRFDDVMADAWQQVAATAWEGYQSSGRGFVLIGFNPQRMDYRTIADAQRWLDPGRRVDEFRRHLSRYKPDREILALVQRCANNAKEARAGADRTLLLYVPTPPGSRTPPEAYRVQRSMDAAREVVEARSQQGWQRNALLQEGIDPDAEPFVHTDTGWQRLHFVLIKNWVGLAAAAWRGYRRSGRGAIVANFASYDHTFFALDAIRDDPAWQVDPWPEALRLTREYDPQREIVLVTFATQDGRDMHQVFHISFLEPPRGSVSPPEAFALENGLNPDAV